MKTTKDTTPKKVKIHIGENGGVRVDAKAFFAQPEVQEQLKKMKDMDIVGIRLDGKYMSTRTLSKDSK